MLDPWERQPGETAKAYGHFVAYCDLGFGRSLAKLHRHYTENGRRISVSALHKLSVKWCWQARVAAHDADLQQQARLAQIEAVREMASRQAEQGKGFQATAKALAERADQYIQLLRVATVETINERGDLIRVVKTNLTPQEIAGLLRACATLAKVGMDMERLARGAAPERVDVFQRVRELAKEMGLTASEEAQAVAAAERILRGRRA